MTEIKLCDIVDASIKLENGGIHIVLNLPKSPEYRTKQKTPSNEWVLDVYQNLLNKGSSKLANADNPTHPVCGGTIDIIGDVVNQNFYILLTRKDLKSPRDPGGHVPNNGFPVDEFEWRHPSLVMYSEGGEERFYYTTEGKLLMPPDLIGGRSTIDAVRKIKTLKPENIRIDDTKIKYLDGPDTIEIIDERGLSWMENGYFAWSSKTGPNFIKLRQINADIRDIIPYDGEGMEIGGKFSPFNREVFVFANKDLEGLGYGSPLHINRSGSQEGIFVWETNKRGERQIQTVKPGELHDEYRPCQVVQRVVGQIVNRGFNAITHEMAETEKRMAGDYDQNPVGK